MFTGQLVFAQLMHDLPIKAFSRIVAAVKLHTLLDLGGATPSFIHISHGNMHGVKAPDILADQGRIEDSAFYVMDKAYVDCRRLHLLDGCKAFFAPRAKRNMRCEPVQDCPFTANTGVTADQRVRLTGQLASQCYPTLPGHQQKRDDDANLVRH